MFKLNTVLKTRISLLEHVHTAPELIKTQGKGKTHFCKYEKQPPDGENYRGKHFDKRSCYNLECNYLELEIGVPLFALEGGGV